MHLSTIFTELRLKKYIELRSIDACEWDCHCWSCIFTGLLYGGLDETYDIVNKWKKDVKQAYSISYKDGLNTIINGKDFYFGQKSYLRSQKRFRKKIFFK